ncbi:hypothetical protein [Ferrimicrobium acidiphilum]|uniref:hypothetical protein n=1 Tax=Ferrimicrobium acidiphilum TaxID=121039 RepID=UPI0023F0804B|nr:hypothetical protein [Ferrimicrobium acidiphilum]
MSCRPRGPVYFTDGPVTLIMALEEEASTSHPSIIEAHAEVLLIRAKLANDLLGILYLEVSER